MAGEWAPITTFADLIEEGALEIGDGYRAKNEELGGDGPIFLRAGHVTDSHVDFSGVERFHTALEPRVRSKLSQPGDAVLTTKGNSTGRTTYVTPSMPPFVYSPHLSYWRSRDRGRIEGGFLRYWSKGSEFSSQLAGMMASTDMAPYLSLIDQKRLRISLPPIEEQRAIAHILGTLDDKIELNRRMNETLEAMARALFKSWFVDFDPAQAKAEGWKFEELRRHIEVSRGFSYDGASIAMDGAPFHNLNSIYEGGGYKYEGIKSLAGEFEDRCAVEPGDIIVANTEQGHDRLLLGSAALVPKRYGARTPFSHHLYRVRVRPGSPLRPVYVLHLLNHPWMHDLVSRFGNGTTVNMLPTDALQLPQISVPSKDVVARFEDTVLPLHHRAEKAVIESETLAAMRDALLPKLISGELRVKSARRVIESAS